MKPEWSLRNTSVASAFTGVSIRRWPRGSFSLPSSVRNIPLLGRVLGIILDSTTLVIHGDHFMAPKYSAAALISSSVMFLAKEIMRFVLALRGSAQGQHEPHDFLRQEHDRRRDQSGSRVLRRHEVVAVDDQGGGVQYDP